MTDLIVGRVTPMTTQRLFPCRHCGGYFKAPEAMIPRLVSMEDWLRARQLPHLADLLVEQGAALQRHPDELVQEKLAQWLDPAEEDRQNGDEA